MKINQLDNYYKNLFIDDKEILALGLPITLIHKHIYNHKNHEFQTKYDLNTSEIDVLATLLFNGKVLSPTDLYEATVFSSGGMTKILKKLQDKGLISRVPSKEDKRSLLVKIEPAGEQLIEGCFQGIIDFEEEVFAPLTKKEQKVFKELLRKVITPLYEPKHDKKS